MGYYSQSVFAVPVSKASLGELKKNQSSISSWVEMVSGSKFAVPVSKASLGEKNQSSTAGAADHWSKTGPAIGKTLAMIRGLVVSGTPKTQYPIGWGLVDRETRLPRVFWKMCRRPPTAS